MLVPDRVLRVGDDTGASDAGASKANGDVGVAGDDLAVLYDATTVAVGGQGLLDGLERGEEAANALHHEVHVRKAPRFDDLQVKVAMKVDCLVSRGFFPHFL